MDPGNSTLFKQRNIIQNTTLITKILLSIFLIFSFSWISAQPSSKILLFVGSYTEGIPNPGIYVYEFNDTTGKLDQTCIIEGITNPSFLSISPDGKYLYACTDTKLPFEGSITSFKIDSIKGKLYLINKQPSGGKNPVFITVAANNKMVINGNYTDGSISVFMANEDGSLKPYSQLIQFKDSSINKTRQEGAHIHSTVFSPDADFLFAPDLGSDKIRVFKLDTFNKNNPLHALDNYCPNSIPGSGPRHLTFHPNGKFAYCIEELSGMVSAYNYHNGKLDSIQRTFSYSKTQESYGSADIHISPDGLFLYTSNRWVDENTISIFSINQTTGKLILIGHQPTGGEHPRNFTIDPSGNFLLVANQITNNIVVFKRDLKTGLLLKTTIEINIPNPSCLQMRKYGG